MGKHLPQEEVLSSLNEMGAVLSGDFHFVGTSGRHLSAYVNKDVIGLHPQHLRRLAEGMAWAFAEFPLDVIAAPPMGAISLGTVVAQEMNLPFVYLEKEGEGVTIKRPPYQQALDDARVGLVEDIITDGITTLRSIKAINAVRGVVWAITAVYNRGGKTAGELGVDNFVPLVDRELEAWEWTECRLCKQRVPIVLNIGHGVKFREEHSEVDVPYIEL